MPGPKPRPLADRFWEKVEWTPGCWEWLAAKHKGYGQFYISSDDQRRVKLARAHRVAFVLAGNVLPEGMDLDHLCSNPGCVNPAHLEPVTHAINVSRSRRAHAFASRTHCFKGHAYTVENTYWDGHRRVCRSCHRIAEARRRLKAAA